MPNPTTGEERHQQSTRPLLADATDHGWECQVIEHDGIRQYRFTRTAGVPGDGNIEPLEQIASAYFSWRSEDDVESDIAVGSWRYACGFDHAAPEVPLRLSALREHLRSERFVDQ